MDDGARGNADADGEVVELSRALLAQRGVLQRGGACAARAVRAGESRNDGITNELVDVTAAHRVICALRLTFVKYTIASGAFPEIISVSIATK